jgi:hypothetical protein
MALVALPPIEFVVSATYMAYALPNQFAGAPKMRIDEEPYSGLGPVLGLLLVALPWVSFVWPGLLGFWLVLVFLFLFLMPAMGRLHDAPRE